MPISHFRLAAYLLLTMIAIGSAQAQDDAGQTATIIEAADEALPQYRVELVVFRNLNPSLFGDEVTVPESSPALSEAGDDGAFSPLEEIPEEPKVIYGHFEQAPADTLQLTNVYTWMRTSNNYSPLLHTSWIQPGYSRRDAVPVALSGAAKGWWFQGDVTLSLERFLRLSFDLQLSGENEPMVFHLNQGRKMRSRTVHYIDHPRFGVIAVINPVN